MQTLSAYIPIDRRHALARGIELPDHTTGAALFADISGFTPLTATLAAELGRKRGAEEVLRQINPVYDAIIAQLHRYGGSVIGFTGDAVTCWFDNQPIVPLLGAQKSASYRAVACALTCALAMQKAMLQFAVVYTPSGTPIELGIKIGIASGKARRFLVGDPSIQLFDALAGATVLRMAAAEGQAKKGEVVVSEEVAQELGDELKIAQKRIEKETGRYFSVISGLRTQQEARWPSISLLSESMMKSWVVGPVYERLRTSVELLGDLRLVTPLFLNFDGIDFDGDEAAGEKLNTYICCVQEVLSRYQGTLIQLAIGDKGCFLYAAFGAPLAHDKDTQRAVAAALALRTLSKELDFICQVQIGISRGQVWTGNCGSQQRRTYDVIGNQVNMAARLMGKAKPGQILVHERVQKAASDDFDFHSLGEMMVKGRAAPLFVFEVIARRATAPTSQRLINSPLIGRKEELARLREALDAVSRSPAPASGGVSRVIIIEGEAGIGKSHLVAELEGLVQERGLKRLLGAGQSIEQYTPYRAGRDIFEAYFGLEQITEQAERQKRVEKVVQKVTGHALIERLPLLNDVLNLGWPENKLTKGLDPSLRQQSLLSFLLTLLRETKEQPLILVIEDAHWLDSLSWEMLLQVTRGFISSNSQFLLLLVTRPMSKQSIGAQQLAALRALDVTETLRLNQLSDQEVVALVTSRLGLPSGGMPKEVADLVRLRAQGNPFFAEELVLTLRDQEFIRIEKQPTAHCVIEGDLSEMNKSLPDTIQGLILARIDKLPAEKQLILKVAAVIGRTFAVTPLECTLQQYIAHISQALPEQIKALIKHNLILLDSAEPELIYIFKHIITQEVAYQTLLFAQRKQLHGQVASWYKTTFTPLDPYYPLLVHHYHHAEEKEQERDYARLAGERAAAQYASDEAIRYFSRALELTAQSERQARYELLLAREKLLDWQGKREAQAKDLAKLSDLVSHLSDNVKKAVVSLRRANYCHFTSDYSNALLAAQQAIGQAQEAQDLMSETEGYQIWGRILRLKGEYEEAQQRLEQALTLAHASQNQGVEAECLLDLGTISFYQGKLQLAEKHFQDTLAIYQALDDRKGKARGLMVLGNVYTEKADYLTAQGYYKQALNVCQTIGYPRGQTAVLTNLGVNYEYLGEYQMAVDCQKKSLAICQQIGNRDGEGSCYCNLALIHYQLGEYERAIKEGKQALAVSREVGHQSREGDTLTYLGHTYTDLGQLQLASDAYQNAIQIRHKLGQETALMDNLAGLARIDMKKEQYKQAYTYIEKILAWINTNGIEGIEYPLEIYLTCYQVLQVTGYRAQAITILKTAYNLLQERANAILDEQVRHKFLTNISFHREICAAWQAMTDQSLASKQSSNKIPFYRKAS